MGFFDDIFADVRVFTDEIQSIKEELVSSVLDPTGELRDTVNEIASEITGNSSAPATSAPAVDDTTSALTADDTTAASTE